MTTTPRPVSKIAVDIIRLNRMLLELEEQVKKAKELVHDLTVDFCTVDNTDLYKLREHEGKEF